MSDEPKKSDAIEGRWQPVAVVSLEKKPDGKPEKIITLFCVNLVAAYAPALVCVWLTGLLSWKENPETVLTLFLISPVGVVGFLMSLVMFPTSAAAGWFCLAAFLLLLFWASAAWHNSSKAWIALPSLVFAYSLLQGLLFAAVINGLNALGGG